MPWAEGARTFGPEKHDDRLDAKSRDEGTVWLREAIERAGRGRRPQGIALRAPDPAVAATASAGCANEPGLPSYETV